MVDVRRLIVWKWVVIAFIVVASGGPVAKLWVARNVDPIEYHKKAYREAFEPTLFDKAQDGWQWLRGKPVLHKPTDRQIARSDRHYNALIDLGYLEKRTFVMTGGWANEPMMRIFPWPNPDEFRRFIRFNAAGTSFISVVALPKDMPKLEEMVKWMNSFK